MPGHYFHVQIYDDVGAVRLVLYLLLDQISLGGMFHPANVNLPPDSPPDMPPTSLPMHDRSW
jgi:hypothetical protein